MYEENQKLTPEELRELFEVLKQYAPLNPEGTRAIFDKLGGLKNVVLGFYALLMREGHLDIAAELVAHVETRSRDPRVRVAIENRDILASMKYEA